MGEYAKTVSGEEVKIGTCEEMYYLRADQRHLIVGYDFDGSERFRFPFPDEDGIEPGSGDFADHRRGVRIPDFKLSDEFQTHGTVQFVARDAGYVCSLPCPEQFPDDPGVSGLSVPVKTDDGGTVRVGRNGFNGHPVVMQQVVHTHEARDFNDVHLDGRKVLATVIACGACGEKWRLPTLEEAKPVADAFRAEAEREEFRHDLNGWGPANSDSQRAFLIEMADRIEAGYAEGFDPSNPYDAAAVS